MNNFVKGALIFTSGVAGGFVLCGITTIKFVVKSDAFRTALIYFPYVKIKFQKK